jgi:hypothetical protein
VSSPIKRCTEVVNISVERHTINGKPTCCAWYGGKRLKRRVCQFLGATHFGTRPVCMATGASIHDGGLALVPADNCPVWKDATNARR